uniref:Peptidase A1 domain-containing protein n=1 Tax=Hanusia phi TaxID=3032 RepID=A0A7S0HVL5_9CRYP
MVKLSYSIWWSFKCMAVLDRWQDRGCGMRRQAWVCMLCLSTVMCMQQDPALQVDPQARDALHRTTSEKFGEIAPALGPFNHSIPLHSTPHGKHYMVDVQLGYNSNSSIAQTARLIVDTGSGDIVIFGNVECSKDSGKYNHLVGGLPCYDYQKSKSFKFNVEGLGQRVNHECQYDQPGHPGAYCKEALLIDGYKAEAMCELAWEDVQLEDLASSSSSGFHPIRTDICIVNDTSTELYKLRYWNNTQGTLGLFYHVCDPGQGESKCETPFPPLLSSWPSWMPRIFSLDLNAPQVESWMYLGAPAGGWKDMEWSETQPIAIVAASSSYNLRYAFHSLEIFHLQVCGVDLFDNFSSHWTAMVDTGAACLSLPQELFDMVLSWTPALHCVPELVPKFDFTDCANSACTESKNLTICYLGEGSGEEDLPVLSFRMSEEGPLLYLPLSSLMINDRPSGKPRVCLNPTDSIAMYRTEQIKDLLYFPKISFGTLALRNLFTSFDMQAMSVGMKNKIVFDPSTYSEIGKCSVPVTCQGAQTYYAPMNTCLDPDCEQFYFHELDQETKTCRLNNAFLVSCILVLLSFSVAEVALSEIYETLSRKLMRNYASSM